PWPIPDSASAPAPSPQPPPPDSPYPRLHLPPGIRSWDIDLSLCDLNQQLKLFITRHLAHFSSEVKGQAQPQGGGFRAACFLPRSGARWWGWRGAEGGRGSISCPGLKPEGKGSVHLTAREQGGGFREPDPGVL
uniref:Microtubule-associated protein 1B/S N-terminal domain-containing protein n=1 Tax=Ornithorhynchus anatinus TaxID=9258 RepID=A0A6I8PG23_ORNAN